MSDAQSAAKHGAIRHATRMAVAREREEILRLLRRHKPAARERFGVARLSIFGSVARGNAAPASDIDVLVQFDGPATSARFFGLQFWLEDLTGRAVDLVTEKALRPELRPYVERDRIDV